MGAFPMWLAPVQVEILPISDDHVEFANKVKDALAAAGIERVEVDARNEKIGYKIREAQLEKVPYMLIIGAKEVESGTVSVRSRRDGELGSLTVDEFVAKAVKEVETKER